MASSSTLESGLPDAVTKGVPDIPNEGNTEGKISSLDKGDLILPKLGSQQQQTNKPVDSKPNNDGGCFNSSERLVQFTISGIQ